MEKDSGVKEFLLEVKKAMLGFKGEITGDLIVGSVYADKLERLIREKPTAALRNVTEIYNKALDDAYAFSNASKEGMSRSYAEAMTGGPAEIVPWAIYNAIGSVYSELDREKKDLALQQLLEIFDKNRYDIVQEVHTAGIREPLLLSDIKIAEPFYWPGMNEGKKVLEKYPDFSSLKEALIDENGLFFHSGLKWDLKHIVDVGKPELSRREGVHSDFIVAYSLLRKGFCGYGEEYAKLANPAFLDRTMQGIVAMRFGRVETENEIEKGKARLIELLPKQLHERIEPLRRKGGWVDYRKFINR